MQVAGWDGGRGRGDRKVPHEPRGGGRRLEGRAGPEQVLSLPAGELPDPWHVMIYIRKIFRLMSDLLCLRFFTKLPANRLITHQARGTPTTGSSSTRPTSWRRVPPAARTPSSPSTTSRPSRCTCTTTSFTRSALNSGRRRK